MPTGKDYHQGRPEGHRQYAPPENSKQIKTASKGSRGVKSDAGAGPPEKR